MAGSKIILDLCGGTGAWSQPYKDAGYDVRLVTLPEIDVREYEPPANVHGILAAVPCTEFAVSGARWWKDKDPALLIDALEVLDAVYMICFQAASVWCAIENPVGRIKRLRPLIGEPRLIFNPCDYGDPWTKKTLLWGYFRPPKKNPVPAKEFWGWRHLGGKSERTKMLRSITPPGFARAFFEANP